MFWNDQGYLLSKRSLDENSIVIDVFTEEHGKCSGIVYGGSSSKKRIFFKLVIKCIWLLNPKMKIK